jgi:hypothetical protein
MNDFPSAGILPGRIPVHSWHPGFFAPLRLPQSAYIHFRTTRIAAARCLDDTPLRFSGNGIGIHPAQVALRHGVAPVLEQILELCGKRFTAPACSRQRPERRVDSRPQVGSAWRIQASGLMINHALARCRDFALPAKIIQLAHDAGRIRNRKATVCFSAAAKSCKSQVTRMSGE